MPLPVRLSFEKYLSSLAYVDRRQRELLTNLMRFPKISTRLTLILTYWGELIELNCLLLILPFRIASMSMSWCTHQHFCSSYFINNPKVLCNQVPIRKNHFTWSYCCHFRAKTNSCCTPAGSIMKHTHKTSLLSQLIRETNPSIQDSSF